MKLPMHLSNKLGFIVFFYNEHCHLLLSGIIATYCSGVSIDSKNKITLQNKSTGIQQRFFFFFTHRWQTLTHHLRNRSRALWYTNPATQQLLLIDFKHIFGFFNAHCSNWDKSLSRHELTPFQSVLSQMCPHNTQTHSHRGKLSLQCR